MLSNFKKRFLDPLVYCPPPLQEQQPFLPSSESQAHASATNHPERINDAVTQRCAITMEDTTYVTGCTCTFCTMRSEIDDGAEPTRTVPRPHSQSNACRSLPSIRSVMEVLYSPSYPGTPSPFPDPPSYSRGHSPASPARRDDPEISPLISSTATIIEGTPLSRGRPNPQDPSLTGVPSQGTRSSRVLRVEPSPPIILDDNVLEEPLPAYSRFDERRPRFPAASDILGPYPPPSVLRQSAR